MRVMALEDLTIKTISGDVQIKTGDIFNSKNTKALIPWIETGKVELIDRSAYKIYSKLLEDHIILAPDEYTAKELREMGSVEVVYSTREIREIMKVKDKEVLKELHQIKKLFEKSHIESIKERTDEFQ